MQGLSHCDSLLGEELGVGLQEAVVEDRLFLVRIFTDEKLPLNSKKNSWEAFDE